MLRSLSATLCLLALAALQFAVVPGLRLRADAADCCGGTMCPMHRQHSQSSSDCGHSAAKTDCACSMNASQPAQTIAIGQHFFVLTAGAQADSLSKASVVIPSVALDAPSATLAVDSPPPRISLA
jgi:hypothetical protein